MANLATVSPFSISNKLRWEIDGCLELYRPIVRAGAAQVIPILYRLYHDDDNQPLASFALPIFATHYSISASCRHRLNQLLTKIIDSAAPEFDSLQEKINAKNPFEGNSEPDIPTLSSKKSARNILHFQHSDDNFDRNEIRLILENFVHPKDLSRDEWCAVGMIFKRYGFSLNDFDEWSRDDSRYDAKDCKAQWDSFKTNDELKDEGYKIGTLINLAKKFGYKPKNIHGRDMPDTDFNGEQYISA